MLFISLRILAGFLALCQLAQIAAVDGYPVDPPGGKIAPKVLIVSMFTPEAAIWYENMPGTGLGNLFAVNISTPGLSMRYPNIHCLSDHSVCQVTTGESEINAATTMTAVLLSSAFDFRTTYFLLAGIAGVSPKYSTLGGVALARYSVQVALQYEFDAREMPTNFSTGYLPYGVLHPDEYPTSTYGTEVMELNVALRDRAYEFALNGRLADNPEATTYRSRYEGMDGCSPALLQPSVVKCDTATSDVYYSGALLSEAFENVTTAWTNGTGQYCMTAQEDNAILEVLVRMDIAEMVDFSRAIVMRTGSNFDRPPKGVTPYEHLLVLKQNGSSIAIENIFNAGFPIVKGILDGWDCTFKKGVKPANYIGDIFGSLGGQPDFGLGSLTNGERVKGNGGLKVGGGIVREDQACPPNSEGGS